MAGLGFFFASILAFVHQKLKVKENPVIEKLENALPQVNCGACGFASCHQYAEALAGGNVDVEPGRVDVAAHLVPELDADVRLIRRLVPGESSVPIDPHQRPADPPVVGREERGDLLQPRGERADERQAWLQHLAFVPRLVFPEPGPIVVVGQLFEKPEDRRFESSEFHDG